MANPWFRLYNDCLDDPKLMFLPRADVGNYFLLLALKNDGGLDHEIPNGRLDEYVALRLRTSLKRVMSLKARLIAANLINDEWQPLAWNKRQHIDDETGQRVEDRKREKDRQRLKEWRAKQREGQQEGQEGETTETPTETLMKCYETASDTETDTETDTDNPTPLPPVRGAVAGQARDGGGTVQAMISETLSETVEGQNVVGMPEAEQKNADGSTNANVSLLPNQKALQRPNQEATQAQCHKKEEHRRAAAPPSAPTFVLPDDIPPALWNDFEEMRKKKKKIMTDRARELAVEKLRQLRTQGFEIEAVMDQTILHAWDSFYPLKPEQNGHGFFAGQATQETPWDCAI